MNNHWHAVVSDPAGMLPRFLQRVHRLVAVVINVFRGRWEALWSSSKPSEVLLESPDDVLDKMVYVLTNPVRAGFVERVSDWPGLWSDPKQLLRGPVGAERPKLYFRRDGKMPTDVQVHLSKPPGFEDMTDEQFVELLLERVAEEEASVAAEFARQKRKPMGAKAVLQQDWRSSPKSAAPRRGMDPHIAARDKEARIRAIERRREFLSQYREALAKWLAGQRKVVFPAGTYMLRLVFHVRCHPPP